MSRHRRREKLPKWKYEHDCRSATTFEKYTTPQRAETATIASLASREPISGSRARYIQTK